MYCEISERSKDTRFKTLCKPHLEHGQPDIAVIHIGSNNGPYYNLDIDASILAEKYKNWEEMY